MLFIVGPHNAGKTTLASFLGRHGFLHIETGDIVRQAYQQEMPAMDFNEWASVRNRALDDLIIQAVPEVSERALNSDGPCRGIVISGNRQLTGVQRLKEAFPPPEDQGHLIV
jgi:adenylate kinase family enzyme